MWTETPTDCRQLSEFRDAGFEPALFSAPNGVPFQARRISVVVAPCAGIEPAIYRLRRGGFNTPVPLTVSNQWWRKIVILPDKAVALPLC